MELFGLLAVVAVIYLVAYLIARSGGDDAPPSPDPPSNQSKVFKPLPRPASPRPQTYIPKRRSTPAPPTPHTLKGKCWVIDGDTIVINKIHIRLFGMDAPEIEDPYGRNAKWALVKLCKGQTIAVELTGDATFERRVGKCILPDGRDLSAEMVKQGHAVDWPKFSGGIYSHLEVPGIRKKLWRCDALQKGRLASRIPD